MKPHRLSMNRLALDLRVPVTRIADIVAERPTPLCDWLVTSKRARKFWLNLQTKHDLEIAEDEQLAAIERDVHPIQTTLR